MGAEGEENRRKKREEGTEGGGEEGSEKRFSETSSRKLDFPGTEDRGLKPLQLDRSGKGDVREVKT